jgi:DNA invertase Pin-like site-specific DNA recombinase
MTRAITYVRVSTTSQADSGLGLEAQAASCHAWCEREGAELAAAHSDEGVSGAAGVDKRPGLLAAIGELRRGDVLLVAKRDRLGRDPIVCAMIERLAERKGARIVSAAGEGTDSDEPTAILMRRIVDAFGEYERLVIGARTKAALQAKRERGEKTGGDRPIGHQVAADGVTLQRDPRETRALQIIRQLREEGLSIRAIAERLNVAGVPARGKTWHATTVARVLKRAA